MSRHGRSSSYISSTNPYLPLRPASPNDASSRRRKASVQGGGLAEATFVSPIEWSNGTAPTRKRTPWLWVLLACSVVGLMVVAGKFGSRIDRKGHVSHAGEAVAAKSGEEEALGVVEPPPTPEKPVVPLQHPTEPAADATPAAKASPSPLPTALDRLYLVAAHIGEQESKASSHLYQLGMLGLALNRTLVLPNAGLGYLGQCRKHLFSEWYRIDALEPWGIPTISQAQFRKRLAPFAERPIRSRFITMGGSQKDSKETRLVVNREPDSAETLAKTWCLLQEDREAAFGASLSFGDDPALVVAGKSDWTKSDNTRLQWGRDVIRMLQADELRSVPVLTVMWGSNYPAFSMEQTPIKAPDFLRPTVTPRPTAQFVHLAYAPALAEIADRLLASLGGPSQVVAVHWRQELVPLNNLVRCGDELITVLKRIRKQKGGAKYLWMASDYPFEEAQRGAEGAKISANSGTFTKHLSQEHHVAMSRFLLALDGSSVPEYTSLWLTAPQLSPPLDLDPMDRGTLGIIDKLVASKANYFLAGQSQGPELCGRSSSYTRAIVAMRIEKGVGTAEGQLGNEVEYWG